MSNPSPSVDSTSTTADNATLIDAISGNLQAFWQALKISWERVLDFWLSILDLVIIFFMDAFGGFILLLLQILPDMSIMPRAPEGGSFALIGAANDFVPLQEGVACLSFLGVVWAARGVYLLARFLRGGG